MQKLQCTHKNNYSYLGLGSHYLHSRDVSSVPSSCCLCAVYASESHRTAPCRCRPTLFNVECSSPRRAWSASVSCSVACCITFNCLRLMFMLPLMPNNIPDASSGGLVITRPRGSVRWRRVGQAATCAENKYWIRKASAASSLNGITESQNNLLI